MEFCRLAQPLEPLGQQEKWWESLSAIGGLGGTVGPCNPRMSGGVRLGGPRGCCFALWKGAFPKSDCRLARSAVTLETLTPKAYTLTSICQPQLVHLSVSQTITLLLQMVFITLLPD